MAGINTAQIIEMARSLGRNLSEEEAQAILSQAYDPAQYGADQNAVMQLLQGGGAASAGQSLGGASGGTSGDIFSIAQQIAGFGNQQQGNLVSSLSDRYKAILDGIGQQASRELGARGIPISSDSAQTFIKQRQFTDPGARDAQAQLAGIQAQPYQDAVGQALSILAQQQGNQFNQGQLDLARQQFEFEKQQALSAQGAGGLGFGGMSGGSSSRPPTTSPSGASGPSTNFQPIGTTQQAANSGFNPSPFSGQNVQYAGQQAAKFGGSALNTASRFVQQTPEYNTASNLYSQAQNVIKSQPVQKAVSSVSTFGKNLASGASNLFKSFFN